MIGVMVTAQMARKVAVAAAYGGGGIGLVGGALWGVMKTEATLARRMIGDATGKPPSGDGVYGRELDGEPIRFAMLGDSAAAGYGVHDGLETPAALIGEGLSNMTQRPVRVTSHAFVGAQTTDLQGQIDAVLPYEPEVVAIVIGTNDVTHGVLPPTSLQSLREALQRLRAAGCEVVVGTCPDLGTVEPLRQPLRSFAHGWSRYLAAQQTIVVVEEGGRSVSLGDLLGHDFAAAPHELFGEDRFHPSPTGYVSMVAAMLPSIGNACGVEDGDTGEYTPGAVLPVSFAAKRAAAHSGTEVSGATIDGERRGPGGRWAAMRRLRR